MTLATVRDPALASNPYWSVLCEIATAHFAFELEAHDASRG